MTRGKRTCKILKDIRRQIAEANDIQLITSECTYKGDCLGTCPRCEAEVEYLEKELGKRRRNGKLVALAGISIGLLSTNAFAQSCNINPEQNKANLTTDSIKNVSTNVARQEVIFEDKIFGADPCVMPTFPNGEAALQKFISENGIYPPEAAVDSISGRVVVQFVIKKDGSIGEIKIGRGKHDLLNREAVKVVRKLPNFNPGRIHRVPQDVWFTMPINFGLGNKGTIHPDSTLVAEYLSSPEGKKHIERKQNSATGNVSNATNEYPVEKPKYPGGTDALIKDLKNSIKYPVKALKDKIEGKVAIVFLVLLDGTIDDIKVENDANPMLEEEVVKAIKTLKTFKPAELYGIVNESHIKLSVNFTINKKASTYSKKAGIIDIKVIEN